MLSEKELHTLSENITTAAVSAGEYIQLQFDKHYDKGHKEVGDSKASQIVTAVDLKAQEIILKHLQPIIEQHNFGILTEESDDDQSRLQKSHFICIDPLDGTLPFTESRTGYAVSIALVTKAGNPVIGVVYVPDKSECYTSIKGAGVWLNNKPFVYKKPVKQETLYVYIDSSFRKKLFFDWVTDQLKAWAAQRKINEIRYHSDYASVRNTLGVMNSETGCYFKFPKQRKGGGSIWDYAATRLFFEELGLYISDSFGKRLHLNNPDTTFMNEVGVIYSTHAELASFIKDMRQQVK